MVEQLQVTANALCKNRAPGYICQNDSESGNGNGHEWTALPLTPSWPFMPSDSIPPGLPDRVLSELFKAALLCSKVLPAGKYISFSVPKDLENGKYLWLCSTLAHMMGSQSLVSPTNYPSSRKSNLLSCCTWCTAFARLAWPTPTFQNLNILCHQPWATLPNMPTPNYFLALYLTCFQFLNDRDSAYFCNESCEHLLDTAPALVRWWFGMCPNFTCRHGIHLWGLKYRKPALQHSVEKWSSHHWLSSAIAFLSAIFLLCSKTLDYYIYLYPISNLVFRGTKIRTKGLRIRLPLSKWMLPRQQLHGLWNAMKLVVTTPNKSDNCGESDFGYAVTCSPHKPHPKPWHSLCYAHQYPYRHMSHRKIPCSGF